MHLKEFSDAEPSTPAERAIPPEPVKRTPARGRLFVHDVALTMGTEAVAMAASLLLTAIVSRWMGATPLSEYLLLRRVLSWTIAAALLGLSTSLPRYVAHSAGNSRRDGAAYFVAALVCMVPAAIAAGVILVLNRGIFAGWLFGSANEAELVIGLALLILGYSGHKAVYGYYRGLLDMTRANLLDLVNMAFLPLLVVLALAHSQTVAVMMSAVGVLMTVSSAVFAIPVLKRLRGGPLELGKRCRQLLEYGVPRVPGEFGAAAVTAVGPLVAVHFVSISKLSPLLLGLNILLVVGYAASPLGVVLLSKVSMMLGHNKLELVQSRLRLLVVAVTELSVFSCIQLAIFADVVVRAWVGPRFGDQMGVIRTVLLAIPFYLFFMTLRSTIDAATVKALNTANVLISLAVYVGLIAICIWIFSTRSLLMSIAVSLLISQVLLAALTARTFRRFYHIGIPWRQITPSLSAALALGGVALAFRAWQSGPLPMVEAAGVECVLAAVYVAVLARLGSGWLAYTWRVGVRGDANWPEPVEQEGRAE